MPGNSFVLKACDKTFLQVYDPNPEDPVTHTLSYMHTKTHTPSRFLWGACKITPTVQSPVGVTPQGLE